MAVRRGSFTTVLPSVSTPAQQTQSSKRETPPTLRSVPYRPLRSPIDGSLALWSEGRRERLDELEAEIQQDDAQRVEEGNQPQDARGAHHSHPPCPCTEDTTSEGRNHVPGSAVAAREARNGKTQDRSVPCRLSEDGTGLSSAVRYPGLSLDRRLSLWESGWRPSALRELPRGGDGFFSGWTHLGQPERFELVKSANRSSGSRGAALTDAELEWTVLSLEEAEDRMSSLDFSEAASVLENVLIRCPGLTLAYYRLALCLLATRGSHASHQAGRLLDCAMFLEGAGNPHLRAAVDLVMRMLRNDAIPEDHWSEDHPKSLGDLRALEAALDQLLSHRR